MAALGYSFSGVVDVPANSSDDNIVENKPGVILPQGSRIDVFLTREAVDVLLTVTIGGKVVFPAGPVNINTVAGSLPSTHDDKVVSVIAAKGDDILIAAQNLTAGALEARALVKVAPVATARLLGGGAS